MSTIQNPTVKLVTDSIREAEAKADATLKVEASASPGMAKAESIFKNYKDLMGEGDTDTGPASIAILNDVNVRKPKSDEWFRVCANPDWVFKGYLYRAKEIQDVAYYVVPAMRGVAALARHMKKVTVVAVMTSTGSFFLWDLPQSRMDKWTAWRRPSGSGSRPTPPRGATSNSTPWISTPIQHGQTKTLARYSIWPSEISRLIPETTQSSATLKAGETEHARRRYPPSRGAQEDAPSRRSLVTLP
jgi:hypothetical protein